ncbi:MAG: GGDEF domain-containing protein [Coriobacteriales bacterium]|nr:GGDEF domain-containing protein [Coriobacteriales bacterium]
MRSQRTQTFMVVVIAVLFTLALATTIIIAHRNYDELEAILEESVSSELISNCVAAKEIVTRHIELFYAINSEEDIWRNSEECNQVIAELRALKNTSNAAYIYVVKELNGKFYFVFDTDEEVSTKQDDDPDNDMFTEYTLSPVHEQAFAGKNSADLMSVEDEWGSFNTASIPLVENGEVIGIVSIDIKDDYITRAQSTSQAGSFVLTGVMIVSLVALLGLLIMLSSRNVKMHQHLYTLANHDAITGLPNRHFLFTHLAEKQRETSKNHAPFAALFIDLDNFKRVNDTAGHAAGDELLQGIAEFLHLSQREYTGEGIAETLTTRIGGDEFLQLTPKVENEEDATALAQSMLKGFREQEGLKRFIQDHGVGLSIGIALYPLHGTDAVELIKYADIAMYHAKHSGKNNFAIYNATMGDAFEGEELSVR